MTNQKEQMSFDLRQVKGNYWAFSINNQPEWIKQRYKNQTVKVFRLDDKSYNFCCYGTPELSRSSHGTFTIFLRGTKSDYDEHVQLVELSPDEASSLKRAFALFKEWVLQKSLEQAKEKKKEIDYTPVVENINQRLKDIKNSIGQEMLRLKTPGLTANEILNTKAQLLSFIIDWFPFGADTCPHCYKASKEHSGDCEDCEYMTQHGCCYDLDSDYQKIREAKRQFVRAINLYWRVDPPTEQEDSK